MEALFLSGKFRYSIIFDLILVADEVLLDELVESLETHLKPADGAISFWRNNQMLFFDSENFKSLDESALVFTNGRDKNLELCYKEYAAEIASWINRNATAYGVRNNPFEFKLFLRGSRDGLPVNRFGIYAI
ncbi:hypothetical protein C2G38_2187728 [Gigaspora rosea]|uniref:Uncharacterized protein n=1 Tax=Gigaspora rosea TaxID=44941 RepID=A0A397V4G3_9GLOM|nr:hypothetical protein C2G38_2187728 [Gigaspora rosea]